MEVYQGDWLAFVQINGEFGFIRDSYGSCSGCDAFEADIGYPETPESLEAFGKRYIDQIQSYEQTLAYAKKHSDWDQNAKQMVEWIQKFQFKMDFDKMINTEKNNE